MFSNIFQGKRVLVTGHTGFKGSWLTLWLHTMGADLTCISLANSDVDSHWNLLDLAVDEYLLDSNFNSFFIMGKILLVFFSII